RRSPARAWRASRTPATRRTSISPTRSTASSSSFSTRSDRYPGRRPAVPGDLTLDRRFPMGFRINHIHLKSPDPKKTADWYVKAFDFEIMSDDVRVFGDRFLRCKSAD